MYILGIDTSCDDTCISVLNVKCQMSNVKAGCFEILSNEVSSQVKLHAKYGGVYPLLAKREHQKNLPIVFKKTLKGAKLLKSEIDLIGVTNGPGLEPCLWQGVNFAKDLSSNWRKPIIPINHIEAHIVANFIRSNFQFPISNFQKLFPAICLVASGGHTQLILMRNIGKYKLIGETRDDAAGECFDKTARILGLGYPGGPIISQQAAKLKSNVKSMPRTETKFLVRGQKSKVVLPRPMIYQKNYDFSFAGLKTAVLYDFKKRSPEIRKSKEYVREMCQEIQQAIIDVLIHKTIKAAKDFKAKSIILGGGVTANDELRKQFMSIVNCQKSNVNFFAPAKKFCTDNAAMIAATAYFHRKKEERKNWKEIEADANLKI